MSIEQRITELENRFSNQVLVLTNRVKELEEENDKLLKTIHVISNTIKDHGIRQRTKFNFYDHVPIPLTKNLSFSCAELLRDNHIIYCEDEEIEIIIYDGTKKSSQFEVCFREKRSSYKGHTDRDPECINYVIKVYREQMNNIKIYKNERNLLEHLKLHLRARFGNETI